MMNDDRNGTLTPGHFNTSMASVAGKRGIRRAVASPCRWWSSSLVAFGAVGVA